MQWVSGAAEVFAVMAPGEARACKAVWYLLLQAVCVQASRGICMGRSISSSIYCLICCFSHSCEEMHNCFLPRFICSTETGRFPGHPELNVQLLIALMRPGAKDEL